eukprot:gene10192-8103_t
MDFSLSHQDAVILHRQEHILKKNGFTDASYALFAKEADEGVVAINRWFRMAGYKAMWEREAFKGVPVPEAMERTDAELMDADNTHVKFCKICQEGKKTTTKLCYVAAAATALLFMTSIAAALVALFTTADAPAIPKIWAVCVGTLASGIAAAVATVRLLDFRERRFISGYNMWQKKGGLSLGLAGASTSAYVSRAQASSAPAKVLIAHAAISLGEEGSDHD